MEVSHKPGTFLPSSHKGARGLYRLEVVSLKHEKPSPPGVQTKQRRSSPPGCLTRCETQTR